jgi:dolichyl-phosphate-mannose--protein O-mannosyl transferase
MDSWVGVFSIGAVIVYAVVHLWKVSPHLRQWTSIKKVWTNAVNGFHFLMVVRVCKSLSFRLLKLKSPLRLGLNSSPSGPQTCAD